MNEENEAAQAEDEGLPEASNVAESEPVLAEVEHEIQSLEQRVIAAIDTWYEAHFHKAAVEGRTPITSDDKDALLKGVTAAVAPATKE
jgi:hypothetical protein